MTELEPTKHNKLWQMFKKYRVHLTWAMLLSIYLYWTLLPEVIFVNAAGITVEQVKIILPNDDKVWRNIIHGGSKNFRYQASSSAGQYRAEIILSDGAIIKGNFPGIKAWNFGHKAIIELSPDRSLRSDYSYSLID